MELWYIVIMNKTLITTKTKHPLGTVGLDMISVSIVAGRAISF